MPEAPTRLSILLAELLIVKFMGIVHAQPIHVPGIFMLVAGELGCLSHVAFVVARKFTARQEDAKNLCSRRVCNTVILAVMESDI